MPSEHILLKTVGWILLIVGVVLSFDVRGAAQGLMAIAGATLIAGERIASVISYRNLP